MVNHLKYQLIYLIYLKIYNEDYSLLSYICHFFFAKEFIYFLPKDLVVLQKHIIKLIKTSQSNIDIAMYNFRHKGFSKLLRQSVKNGVDVNFIFDEKKSKQIKNQDIIISKKKV